MASADVPFVFQESTADFQSVTIQGQLTYRVANPKRLASLLDFSVDKRCTYYSEDPRKLPERLIHTLQTLARAITQRLVLKDASDPISRGPLSLSLAFDPYGTNPASVTSLYCNNVRVCRSLSPSSCFCSSTRFGFGIRFANSCGALLIASVSVGSLDWSLRKAL